MDTLTNTLTVTGLLLFMAAILAPALFASWRRVMNDAGTLQLWQVMERRGLAPADAAGEERALAVAVRRCTMCPSLGKCEQYLAHERDDVDAFCPNTMFLDNLGRAKARR